MKTVLKFLRAACCLGATLVVAVASDLERVTMGAPEISREKEREFAELEPKLVELSERLNAQLDAAIGDPPMSESGAKNDAVTTGKNSELRPLYLRRHGISAGTRVEWVTPVGGKGEQGRLLEKSPTAATLQPYVDAATGGNARAMAVLGLIYHQGEGVPRDLLTAHDWYMKAAARGDVDALNNLGVLYRDGFAGRQNRKIAYVIFLAAWRSGEGSAATQTRAQRNAERLSAELSAAEINEGLSYTWPYVRQVVRSQGTDYTIDAEVLPAVGRPRIRDNGWWREEERKAMTFESPVPWNIPPPGGP